MLVVKIENNHLRRGRIIRYAPLFLWIGVIFFLSSSNGSMSRTSLFIRPLLEWLFPLAAEETLQIYHGYIRKFAHFFEYAMLAFFASRAFWSSSKEFLRKFWTFFAFLIVLLVASTDEFNQSFNSLRTASIYDVLLDASGGIMMILFFLLYRKKVFSKG
ncbi:VanZ family protein [soil metagenome]